MQFTAIPKTLLQGTNLYSKPYGQGETQISWWRVKNDGEPDQSSSQAENPSFHQITEVTISLLRTWMGDHSMNEKQLKFYESD